MTIEVLDHGLTHFRAGAEEIQGIISALSVRDTVALPGYGVYFDVLAERARFHGLLNTTGVEQAVPEDETVGSINLNLIGLYMSAKQKVALFHRSGGETRIAYQAVAMTEDSLGITGLSGEPEKVNWDEMGGITEAMVLLSSRGYREPVPIAA